MTCPHDRSRILTYDAAPYRWIEQCYCGQMFAVTLDNHRLKLGADEIDIDDVAEEPRESV